MIKAVLMHSDMISDNWIVSWGKILSQKWNQTTLIHILTKFTIWDVLILQNEKALKSDHNQQAKYLYLCFNWHHLFLWTLLEVTKGDCLCWCITRTKRCASSPRFSAGARKKLIVTYVYIWKINAYIINFFKLMGYNQTWMKLLEYIYAWKQRNYQSPSTMSLCPLLKFHSPF